MGLNETACLHAADAGGFGFANSWTSDGRCRGLAACPYEFNCTARGCSTYDAGAKSYTHTALSGPIFTILTVLSWICVGIHMCGALPCPVCA